MTSPTRLAALPEVPTFAEAGYPTITGMGFNALYAPPNTPAAAVAAWNKGLAKVMAQPDVKDKLILALATGFYVGRGFVHVDTGDERLWIDSGRRPKSPAG